MTTNSEKVPNRLVNEKSPYLLQHAYNPVNWYSWGNEAFEKAKTEDKPIFLSIGYSTCHWCHVMERESFEDQEVAEILNKNYIAIKVDREERPDIDNIYMTYCQVITGSGGWPLSIFMSCDKKPFFAGTYFPKHNQYGRTGFIELLNNINDAWQNNKEKLLESGDTLHKELSQIGLRNAKGKMDSKIIETTFNELKYHYDKKYGGFSDMPKFPTPHNLLFLFRYYAISNNEEALKMAEETLISMYKGGIFDHVGFGFSRYSTDSIWLVPHFEKMLYDNALLAFAYVEAFQITKKNIYKKIADKIFKYILRDMEQPEGGFYSAEDADSEGVEGKFYIWTMEELQNHLEEDEFQLFSKYYDITVKGNFEEKNIPNLINTNINDIQSNQALEEKMESILSKLYLLREKRIHPFKDDKILTSWNGIMIAALSYGGRVFNNNKYIEASEKALNFIMNKLIREDGRLLSRYREGEAANPAFLEDYGFFIWGLIETYNATFNSIYLEYAAKLNEDMIKLFYDNEKGGFYLYGIDSEELIMRPKDFYDGAIPSGNSMAVINTLRLSKILGKEDYNIIADKTFDFSAAMASNNPAAYTNLITAYINRLNQGKEIVIAGMKSNEKVREMLNGINEKYRPFDSVILNNNDKALEKLIPFIKEQREIDGEAAAYICENYACSKPTTDLEEFLKLMK